MTMAKGKLIVFEGTDGSGKGTQTALCIAELQKRDIPYKTMDFPRYSESFFGEMAGHLLRGDFGSITSIPPQLAVLPFACDRWLLKDQLIGWLAEGYVVVSNRYTASSAVYHAAKLPEESRQKFIDWVYRLEQEVIGLPKEDVVLYIYMPVEISRKLVDTKKDRPYLAGKKKDMYEEDMEVQTVVDSLYQHIASTQSHWKTINCVMGETLRTPDQIQKDILDVLTINKVL